MKKLTALISLLALLLVCGPALAQDEAAPSDESSKPAKSDDMQFNRVQIMVNYWPASYTGTFTYEDLDVYGGTATVIGNEVDLVDELGLNNPQNIYEIEGLVNITPKHQLMLSYFNVDYGGEDTLGSKVEMGGYSFAPATKLETTFKITRLKFMYTYFPLVGDAGKLGVQIGLNYFWWEVGFKGTELNTGVKVDESDTLPIPAPVAGLTGRLNLPLGFGLQASYSGVGFTYEDVLANYTDFEGGLTYDYKYLHVGVGYRMLTSHLRAKTDVDDAADPDAKAKVEYETTQGGVMITVGANF